MEGPELGEFMKYRFLMAALVFAAFAPVAVAQESASRLSSPHAHAGAEGNASEEVAPLAPAFELQFSYGRLAGVSLGIPVGSHVHLEAGVGAYDVALETDGYSTRQQVFGGNLRLRIDFASPTASFRPFIRIGGDLWRGRNYGGRWREWDVRLTAGAQVRVHRHFGIEVDAGVWYGRVSGDTEGRGLGLQYGLGLVIYI